MSFHCPKCGTPLSLREQHLGKKVRCPGCQATLRIPVGQGNVVVVEEQNDVAGPRGEPAAALPAAGVQPGTQPIETSAGAGGAPIGMPPVPPVPPHFAPPPVYQGVVADATPDAWGYPASSGSSPSGPSIFDRTDRPMGVVWIVFLYVFQGLNLIALSTALAFMGSFVGAIAGRGAGSSGPFGSATSSRSFEDDKVLASLTIDVGTLLTFHFGLFLLVAAYGLWTARTWGLPLAFILSVVAVVISVIAVIAAIVSGWGILSAIAGVLIWIGVTMYLNAATPGRWRRLLQQALGSIGAGG